jgi:tetratricopeptide (TPR) repeat protein
MHSRVFRGLAAVCLCSAAFGQTLGVGDPGDFLSQAQALLRQGRDADALTMYRRALTLNPESATANSAAGVAADLAGEYAAARAYFARAIQFSSGAAKIRALRDLAVSFGFSGNCKDGERYAQEAYGMQLALKDFYNAGEVANEFARLCIDAGELDLASQWYKTGYEAGLREPDIKPDRKNLWEFRWEHAQARIAARRTDREGAQRHAEAARAILAKGDNPQQEQFLPYVLGYVAFYGGDFKTAYSQFQQAPQNDAFIAVMIGQTLELLGDAAKALDYYRRALTVTSHNPPVAYGRPLARKRIAELAGDR